jgi:hypothetical protein
MPYISEHYAKEKRECETSEKSWVDLFIKGYSVSVNYLLEYISEFIKLEVCWWFYCRFFYVIQFKILF